MRRAQRAGLAPEVSWWGVRRPGLPTSPHGRTGVRALILGDFGMCYPTSLDFCHCFAGLALEVAGGGGGGACGGLQAVANAVFLQSLIPYAPLSVLAPEVSWGAADAGLQAVVNSTVIPLNPKPKP